MFCDKYRKDFIKESDNWCTHDDHAVLGEVEGPPGLSLLGLCGDDQGVLHDGGQALRQDTAL